MTFKNLKALLIERARIDGTIRAERVKSIRRISAMIKLHKKQQHLVNEMDRRLMLVNYCHLEFDELLDEIESFLH
jgi:hypothetical protein